MKQWLAIFFLSIFSFQLLPVKEIGKLLFKGQTTEEVHADIDNGNHGGKMKGDCFNPFLDFSQSFASTEHCNQKAMMAIHKADNLPTFHVADIFTPPPNQA